MDEEFTSQIDSASIEQLKPIPAEVKVIRRIVQGVQSPANRGSKTPEELLAAAKMRLNNHRLSPFRLASFDEAFRIALQVHDHVAANPENANAMVLPFKNALLGVVNFADYIHVPNPETTIEED